MKRIPSGYQALLCLGLALCLWPLQTRAQQREAAFRNGEELNYMASYSAAIVSTDVASVVLRTSEDMLEGTPVYKIHGRGQTRSFFSVFFKLDDIYESWLERSSLKPMLATSTIREGNYRKETRISFNTKAGMAYTNSKNLKRKTDIARTLVIGNEARDPLAHLFYLRSSNLSGMRAGESRTISLVMVDTIERISYKYLGKEILDMPSTGPVRCLKFSCQLAPGEDGSFAGGEFLVWLSDDKNKIPVYLETPIRVGKVYVTLTGWKNLAHPFTSQVELSKK